MHHRLIQVRAREIAEICKEEASVASEPRLEIWCQKNSRAERVLPIALILSEG